MVLITEEMSLLINGVTFFSFVFLAGVVIHLGRSTSSQNKITLPWVNLALGIILIGLGYLTQTSRMVNLEKDLFYFVSFLAMMIGSMLTFASFAMLYTQKVDEVNRLSKRENEIKLIMKKLREKYFKREIPEDDLKKMHADLIKELTEIEVRLSEIKKKK